MNLRFIPGFFVVLLSVFVYGLTYYTENREKPAPSYDFYQPAIVQLDINGGQSAHNVYGQYNNILEGKREIVQAAQQSDKRWRIDFSVNSPRPATIFIDDEPFEVFLTPGDSSLAIHILTDPETYLIDTLSFMGENASICKYLKSKSQRFRQVKLRSNRKLIEAADFQVFTAKLDSMAARELAFLAEQEIFNTLPDWFVTFEKSDILYQKAYLKLTQAYNQTVAPELLDEVLLNNSAAQFSYYYYLYLTAYINDEAGLPPGEPKPTEERYFKWYETHLYQANLLIHHEPHDVYFTRLIFNMLTHNQLEAAAHFMDLYDDAFFSKKYLRFLRLQLENRQEEIERLAD